MYKAIFKIENECINVIEQEIFTPFINCFQMHSVMVYVNGLAQEQDFDYKFIGHKTKWLGDIFDLHSGDSIVFDMNYFYIRPDDIEVLGFLVDTTYLNPLKSKEIISKHYIEGQFSLDNGLYKNAVLNFGTTLDGILNKNLVRKELNDLIIEYSGEADKESMHFIRQLRNKVHTNQISASQDISRTEAIEARNKLETILYKIK